MFPNTQELKEEISLFIKIVEGKSSWIRI